MTAAARRVARAARQEDDEDCRLVPLTTPSRGDRSPVAPDATRVREQLLFPGFFRLLRLEDVPDRPWEGPIPYFSWEDVDSIAPLGTEGTAFRLEFPARRGPRSSPAASSGWCGGRTSRARAHLREVGAYVVSHLCGLAVVPPTVLARVEIEPDYWPLGALQSWVDGEARDLPEEQLAAMAALDYLVGNTDRHRGNFLVDRSGQPWGIDHTASFPCLAVGARDAYRGAGRGAYENRAAEQAWEGTPLPDEVTGALRRADADDLWRAILDLRLETDAAEGVKRRLLYLQERGCIPPFARSAAQELWQTVRGMVAPTRW
jgi:hypothetical protein